MNLETGKTYLVSHIRKGTFAMRVNKQDDTWTYGVVAGGKADAVLDYNEKEVNEPITVRTSFLESAIEQPA